MFTLCVLLLTKTKIGNLNDSVHTFFKDGFLNGNLRSADDTCLYVYIKTTFLKTRISLTGLIKRGLFYFTLWDR